MRFMCFTKNARLTEGATDYRMMVAVANPKNALQLVMNTYRICDAKKAGVELIHMVPVPSQVPLSDAETYMLEGREAITEMMLYLTPLAQIATTLRYCRNAARGIISAVHEKRINMLVMGWHGRYRSVQYSLGSTVDPILEQAPCNIVMMKNCGENRKFKRILVPIAGGPNSAFAMEVAGIIADPDEGETVPSVRKKSICSSWAGTDSIVLFTIRWGALSTRFGDGPL